jgi:hypothetical protein
VQLKLADILGRSRFGGPLEKRREPLAAADMALCVPAQSLRAFMSSIMR